MALAIQHLVPRSRFYGPSETCTLNAPGCPTSASVYGYRPTLPGSATLIALYAVVLVFQLGMGVKYRAWSYAFAMFWGCVCEIVGYSGRILIYQNPFVFSGFIMQIVLITIGPAFFSAAIYLTLSRGVVYLGAEYSRFKPVLLLWVFIPCDIVSLSLQGSGGGLSSSSSGSSQTGVDIAIAGLVFQVFTLTVFVALAADYALRYSRGTTSTPAESRARLPLETRFKVFALFQAAAIILILIRCCYRIYELNSGYKRSAAIRNEPLFIALESSMVIAAAFCLCVAHPGPVFASSEKRVDEKGSTKVEYSSA